MNKNRKVTLGATQPLKVKSVSLSNDLTLSALSIKNNQIESVDICNIEHVDLQYVNQIDSAGLAYLARLKILNPKLSFSGYSEKIMLLSNLYGLNFLFIK